MEGDVLGHSRIHGELRKCQMYSGIRRRDELHPTFSPTINIKWMVDIVVMPIGIKQRKYLVLAREDLTNQVEGGCTLWKKMSAPVCWFLREEVFYKYRCIGYVIADQGEIDSDKAREFFIKNGVQLTRLQHTIQRLKGRLNGNIVRSSRINNHCGSCPIMGLFSGN